LQGLPGQLTPRAQRRQARLQRKAQEKIKQAMNNAR
jgi:hypothetical protein